MIKKMKQLVHKCIDIATEQNAINISTAILHQKTFPQFKNYCEGKNLVVCGAGPTLQKYKPIEDAVHIAVNRSFLYEPVQFDFIFAQDMDGIRMVQNELIQYRPGKCIKLLGTQLGNQKEIPEALAIKCEALRFNTDLYIYKNGYKSKCVQDIDSRAIGNMPNAGMSVLQFALYMNPNTLYIVGCDMTGTHFADGNQAPKGLMAEKELFDSYWITEQKKLLDKWLELKRFASVYYPETKIISVNPIGLRGVFEDLDY